MKRRIFGSLFLLSLVTVLLSILSLSTVLYQQISEDIRRELSNQIAILETGMEVGVGSGVEEEGLTYLQSIKGIHDASRITLIDTNGVVLFDNHADITTMDNHLSRPEVIDALNYGRGESVRMSDTLNSQTYYLATRLADGRILRVSSTTDSVFTALMSSVPALLGITLVILCLAILIARALTKRIVEPINNLDLEHPIENTIYDELSPLLIRIHHQRDSIERQVQEIQRRANQFQEITEKMEEGLVVLDDEGYLLSINKSAIGFLGVELANPIGKHYLNLNRSNEFQKAIEEASRGKITERVLQAEKKRYQLRTTPILVGDRPKGVILLLLDITEKQETEKIRREFTANVSHELKTPLTAISGYAELIKDGLAKDKDIPQFAIRIYEEANNLLHLIEDVIKLSQLDEKSLPFPKERVNLLNIVKSVEKRLTQVASRNGVALTVSGEESYICGVPQMVLELVSNLCDNAIKYNREGGNVAMKVSKSNGKVQLVVADTGIGIPKEQQGRIFERFYRVDKSHSKETGGTGLGLSIVKHIASFHQADIRLDSAPEIGTTVTVSFSEWKEDGLKREGKPRA